MKTNHSKFIFTLFSFFLFQYVGAANYYVSTSGNDNNNGTTTTNAWKTVSKACTSVGANAGHVINIGAGTFNEAGNIVIPSGITIKGAGKTSTTIKVAAGNTIFTPANNSINIIIVDVKLDGTNGNNNVSRALNCRGINGFEAKNISLVNFYQSFLFYSGSNISIHDFDGTNSSYCNYATFEFITSVTNAQIYNGTLVNDDTQKGKAVGAGPDQSLNPTQPWALPKAAINNLVVHDLSHNTASIGCWPVSPGNYPPQICIEYWHVNLTNCEIYNCVFNNTLSIQSNGTDYPANQKTLRIHHNRWDICRGYQIEAESHNMEIDHNFLGGNGYYPIAQFNQNETIRNLKVHHNVFEGNSWSAVMNFEGTLDNFTFANNTVNYSGTGNIIYINKGCVNSTLKNNNFVSSNTLTTAFKGVMPGAISNNIFYNLPTLGSAFYTSNPQFTATGTKPNPYFNIASTSPAKNTGVVVTGITDDGTAVGVPDIGSYENGGYAWAAGINGTNSGTTPPSTYYTVPGTVESENYAGMYGVQNETCSEGGLNVGYIESGDWMDYNINPSSSGLYTLELRYANGSSTQGVIDVRSGSNVLATFNTTPTGSWQSYSTITKTFSLNSGNQVLRLSCSVNGMNLNWMKFTAGSGITPIKIESENYSSMSGIATETTTDTGGGLNVGWIDAGDWMDYSVNILTSGSYKVGIRVGVGNGSSTNKIDLKLGNTVLSTVTLPNTGGYQVWATTTSSNFSLNAGVNTIRVYCNTAGYNLNWLEFMSAGAANVKTNNSIESSFENSNSIDAADKLIVYSNPSSGAICVNVKDLAFNTLRIFNIEGRLLIQNKLEKQNQEFRLDNFKGWAIVKLYGEKSVVVKKVLIQ